MQRGKDWWVIPGGTLRDDETLQENARREAFEELGLEVEILEGDPLACFIEFDERKIILFNYRAERTNSEITQGDEISEWGWFGADELPANVSPNIRQIVDHFMRK